MKRIAITIIALMATCGLWGQENGVVVYSLPKTNLHLTVEALCESYTPGIYSQYAQKFLGIDVPKSAQTQYTLMNIKLNPLIEADRSKSYIANLNGFENKTAPASFFKMTSQGVIILSDENKGGDEYWRFPTLANFEVDGTQATGNLTVAETTLYRQVKNEQGGYDKVATTVNQVVEKSIEKKAQEAANTILSLRTKRMEIITGDTDATFSGEALSAAISEINRLEQEYMELFIGTVNTHIQKMSFDVLPQNNPEEEMIVAFRFSDTAGLLQTDEISGRPIVLEVIPEVEQPQSEVEIFEPEVKQNSKNVKAAAQREDIKYRVPSVCNIKIFDGQELILQSRVPVYQKGETLSFPLSVIVK